MLQKSNNAKRSCPFISSTIRAYHQALRLRYSRTFWWYFLEVVHFKEMDVLSLHHSNLFDFDEMGGRQVPLTI